MASSTALNESHDDYPRVVANLNERWRVVECRDRVQWVLQWRSGGPETCRSDTWKGRGYFRTSEVLKRSIREERLSVDPAAEIVLAALPDWLEGDLGPIPVLRYGRHTRLASNRISSTAVLPVNAVALPFGTEIPCPTHCSGQSAHALPFGDNPHALPATGAPIPEYKFVPTETQMLFREGNLMPDCFSKSQGSAVA